MTVFAVLYDASNIQLKMKVEAAHPIHYEIAGGQTLISAEGMTTRQIAETLGPKGELGNLLILPVANYWGWHNQDLWEWLRINSAAS